jgi:AGCS family alanine or glycine:cation symporter
MWLLAFLGMMTKTVEITLGVHFREIDENGHLHGGPMYYIQKGLKWSFLAKIFTVAILVDAVLGAAILQPYTVGSAFQESYDQSPYIITTFMAIITGFVVIGGIKRIGQFCEKIVPVMAAVYIIGGIIIFIWNYDKIPEVFHMIIKYAFNPTPRSLFGGAAGITISSAIKNGVDRGMFSNEAGMGTAPMVHATADTTHPFKQGLWGAFEVFFDTTIICTITAFAVLSTGVLSSGKNEIKLVIKAFSVVFPENLAGSIIFLCTLFFCLSTQIGFFVYYQTAIEKLFGYNAFRILKWFYIFPGILFAGVKAADKLWSFASISVAFCAIPNLIAIIALRKTFMKLKDDFVSKRKKFALKPAKLSETEEFNENSHNQSQ